MLKHLHGTQLLLISWYGRVLGIRTLNPLSAAVPMHVQGSFEWVRGVCIALMALVFATPALAEKGRLRERLTPQVMAVVYPRAQRLGVGGGSPPPLSAH